MAITIVSTTHDSITNASAHSELWHVVDSDNKATDGFKYIFDIYKSNTLLARIRNNPYGDDKYGILDVHNIVRSQLPNNKIVNFDPFSFDTAAFFSTDILFTDYSVRYGEISGGVLSANLASGTYRAWNNYNRPTYDNKTSQITGAMVLSNRPTDIVFYSEPNAPIVISAYYPSGQTFVRQERVNGTITNSYSNSGNDSGVIYGYTPTSERTVLEISGSVSGMLKSYNVKRKCAKYDTHTLLFLNAYGAWDSFTFVHGKKTFENQKKKFQSQNWFLDPGPIAMSNRDGRPFLESSKYYSTDYYIKMQLTSDILSTDDYDWLAELVNSPQVYYLDIATEDFIPVMITDTNYEFKDERINKAETLIVNIEFSEKTNTQFR